MLNAQLPKAHKDAKMCHKCGGENPTEKTCKDTPTFAKTLLEHHTHTLTHTHPAATAAGMVVEALSVHICAGSLSSLQGCYQLPHYLCLRVWRRWRRRTTMKPATAPLHLPSLHIPINQLPHTHVLARTQHRLVKRAEMKCLSPELAQEQSSAAGAPPATTGIPS